MSKKNTNENAPQYVATLKLMQNDLRSPITMAVEFDPLISMEDRDDIPGAYFEMAGLAEAYLIAKGTLDENGELVDEDEVHTVVNQISISDRFNDETKH